MGASFTNYQVHISDAQACAKAVANIVRLRALVTDARAGWVSVYDEKSESQDLAELQRVASALSTTLATHVFAFLLHDSDVFVYILYQKGKLVDQYNSNPDCFGPMASAERKKFSGDFKNVLPLAPAKTSIEKMLKVVRQKYVFQEKLVNSFARLMGMDPERACLGFKYAQEAEHDFTVVHGQAHSSDDAALLKSVETGDAASVRALLAKKISPNGQDRFGHSLLVNALRQGRTEIAAALLGAGGDPFIGADGDAVWAAAAHGNREILAILLQRRSKQLDASLPPALTNAVLYGHVEVVEDLLKAGADPNVKNQQGWTPLMTACFRGPEVIWETMAGQKFPTRAGEKPKDWPAMIAVLLKAGANVNAQDSNGMTALMLARATGQNEIVELLQQAGADPTLKPAGGKKLDEMIKLFQSTMSKSVPEAQSGGEATPEASKAGQTPGLAHLDPKIRKLLLQQLTKAKESQKK